MRDLVVYLAKAIVEKPDAVEATVTEDGPTYQILLRVAEEDKGKIIGRQGKVIKALRAVAGAAAEKSGRQVLLDLE